MTTFSKWWTSMCGAEPALTNDAHAKRIAMAAWEAHAGSELGLATALAEINRTIFAVGAPLGSAGYFTIRGKAVDALKAAGLEELLSLRGDS